MQLFRSLKKNPLMSIYIAVFFFSVQSAITSYINSSFLTEGRSLSESKVGLLYTLGSCITLIVLIGLPRIIHKISLKKVLVTTLLLLIALLVSIIRIHDPFITGLLFILYLTTSSGILFLNDIFVEHYTNNTSTGKIRGIFFTVINFAWVVSPLLAGIIAQSSSGYTLIYILALILTLLSFIVTIVFYSTIQHTATTPHIPLLATFKKFFKHFALRRIFIVSILLQLFYAVMIIYSPLYLHQVMRLSWTHIGLAFTGMLTAFVLFQIPLGRLADKKYGEKEILSLGLIIMTVMTVVFAFLNTPHWYVWALVLFGTRVGAAAVEIMCESYFFKQITDSEHSAIALFRSTSPLAYILAPLIVSGLLTADLLNYQQIFILLAVCLGLGLFVSFRIVDTK